MSIKLFFSNQELIFLTIITNKLKRPLCSSLAGIARETTNYRQQYTIVLTGVCSGLPMQLAAAVRTTTPTSL